MQHWSDSAIVLKAKKISEYDGIVTVLTKEHGKQNAVVKGAYSKRMRPFLEQGNVVHVVYKSRTEEQLGMFALEGDFNPSATILGHSGKLTALSAACSVIDKSLVMGQNVDDVYDVFKSLLTTLDSDYWVKSYCQWEVALLSELGVRLDFSSCAGNGSTESLIYVSPKSARAVSAVAGQIYKKKLLPLPQFLLGHGGGITGLNAYESLMMTGHFLHQSLMEHGIKELPEVRGRLKDYFYNRENKVIG